ncbi:MAG: hypothetical protein ACRC46_02970 [Thermoguttaceae bacterium]
MSNALVTAAKVVHLANRLEEDIRTRFLKPGDSYYSTQDASRFLGVAGSAANRALQLLEKRNIIKRRQRLGAVILPASGERRTEDADTKLTRVHFLVHEKYLITEGVGADGIFQGLQSVLPSAHINHCFLAAGREEEQVADLIDRALRDGGTDAFVLVRASFGVQQLLAESRLPAVVHGTCYSGISNLSSLDRDHAQAAKLTAEFLKKCKSRHAALLMRQFVLPGDHIFLDSLLAQSKCRWQLRFAPADDAPIMAECHQIFASGDRPDAVICQTARHARCLTTVLKEQGLVAGKDVAVLVQNYYVLPNGETVFPHLVSDLSPADVGAKLATLLMAAHNNCTTLHDRVPVHVVLTV